MSRPHLPKSELHERSFRVRLKDDDAALLLAEVALVEMEEQVLLPPPDEHKNQTD
jgi:hypothetical protein